MAVDYEEVEESLYGIPLPMDKDGVVDYALSQGASDDVINALEEMHGDRFTSIDDIVRAIR